MSNFGEDSGLMHEAVVTSRSEVRSEAVREVFKALAHTKGFWAKVVALLPFVFRIVAGFDRDMRKDKWELLSDHDAKDGEFVPELMEFVTDEDENGYISGDEMVKMTEREDSGGQRHAEAMLRDQHKIPEEWRKYVLVFPETVWRNPDGRRRVADLYWDGYRWCLSFAWLELDFRRFCRVVRLRKVSSGT